MNAVTRTIITDEERIAIYQDFCNGMIIKDIAIKYGHSNSSISWQIRKTKSKLGIVDNEPTPTCIWREALDDYIRGLWVGQHVNVQQEHQLDNGKTITMPEQTTIRALYPHFARTDHGDILYQDLYLENVRR